MRDGKHTGRKLGHKCLKESKQISLNRKVQKLTSNFLIKYQVRAGSTLPPGGRDNILQRTAKDFVAAIYFHHHLLNDWNFYTTLKIIKKHKI